MTKKIWKFRHPLLEQQTKKEKIIYQPLIEHLSVGYTDSGEFLLFPRPETDMASHLVIAGQTQTGKTTAAVSILGRKFHNWGERIFIINDNLGMMASHRFSEKSPLFLDQLKHIHQTPQGLPIALLYPSTDSLNIPPFKPKIKLSIPIREFIERPESFFKISKTDKGHKHFIRLQKDFLQCNSFQDIEAVIDKYITGKQMAGLNTKLKVLFESWLSKKIFDMDNPDSYSVVTMNYEGEHGEKQQISLDPIVALLLQNMVPVLCTRDLQTRPFVTSVYEFYLNQIMSFKQNGQPLEDIPLTIFVDELNTLLARGKLPIIDKIASESGNLKMNLLWSCQCYDDKNISTFVKTNTKFGLIFEQKEEGANQIRKDFNLSKNQKQQLMSLEKFECMAVGKWLLFDPITEKITINKSGTKCKIFPPLSMHRPKIWNPVFQYPTLQCKYSSGILIQGSPFMIPYDMKKYQKPHNFAKYYPGQNLIKQLWDDTPTTKQIGLDELERKGVGILEIAMPEIQRYYPGQEVGHWLYNLNQKIGIYVKARKLTELPQGLHIQMDVRKKWVRLFGRTAGPSYGGEWFVLP